MTEGSSTAPTIQIVIFTKDSGPLTKRISLVDGKVKSDGSACTMARGRTQRLAIAGVDELATVIAGLSSSQAIAIGSLRPDLPAEVAIITKDQVDDAVERGDGLDIPPFLMRAGGDLSAQTNSHTVESTSRACTSSAGPTRAARRSRWPPTSTIATPTDPR
jgi:hypothetical protein